MFLKAGKGGRPENYKQVRWKLQSDRLNRGWKDQPARGTNKGHGRSQLAQVDDLLARTCCFKCGRKQPQIPRLSSVAWFTSTPAITILETGFVLIAAVTILVQVLLEAIVMVFLKTILLVFLEVILLVFLEMTVLVFLEMILVFVTLETNPVLTMTLKTNPLCMLILETVCVLKLIFNEMMKLFSMFVRMM